MAIEYYYGTSGDDYNNYTGSNTLVGYGYAGNDFIRGNNCDDSLYGGDGNDTLDGGTGNDSLVGGSGNDVYYVDSASDWVTEYSGKGTDTVYSSVNYTLGANVENLTLTSSATQGTGNDLDNTIYGNTDYNYSNHSYYSNNLSGGAGNDTITGGYGNDTISGGDGNDYLWGNYYGNDSISGGAGNDTIYGGYYGNNSLSGDAGNDTISGGYGNDSLYGDYGNDSLSGGSGNDLINGYNYFDIGTEYDTLTGGTGADTFVLGDSQKIYYGDNYDHGFATITDFSSVEGDTIQLFGSSSDYHLSYGNYGGSSATDTFIYEDTNSYGLIGVVQDTVLASISSGSFQYVV